MESLLGRVGTSNFFRQCKAKFRQAFSVPQGFSSLKVGQELADTDELDLPAPLSRNRLAFASRNLDIFPSTASLSLFSIHVLHASVVYKCRVMLDSLQSKLRICDRPI